ncbi:MAG: hypothetical protein ACJAVK_003281 [Akkermansiaceae bacterium]|jgi:hypothetical protein
MAEKKRRSLILRLLGGFGFPTLLFACQEDLPSENGVEAAETPCNRKWGVSASGDRGDERLCITWE